MSKHLRFGRLLGLLAIMLTLSFAWSQAQNLSSKKKLLSFGFTTAANPTAQLGADRWATVPIDTVTRLVAVTVPFETNLTGLIASFTSSDFSFVYNAPAPLRPITANAAISGVRPANTWVSGTMQTWTVEAENYSFENYFITVTKAPASSAKDILATPLFRADVAKPWLGNCTPNGPILIAATNVVMTGTNITMNVPYGTRLDDITVYFSISPLATSVPASGTAVDFDTNNDGVPDAIPFVVTAQNGSTQTYNVLPTVGQPSYDDNLLGFTVSNSTSIPVITYATQTITTTVAFSATSFIPSWSISPYAKMYASLPPAVPPTVGPFANICSGTTSYQLTGQTTVMEFWIQGEKPTEVSRFVLTVTKDAASVVNTLTSIAVDFTKANACGVPYTKTGVVGSINPTLNTVTFNLPFGVTSVKVSAFAKTSGLSTTTLVLGESGTVLSNGSTFTITSESGAVNTYTVVFVNAIPSNDKQIKTYGFHMAQNAQWLFPDWTVNYPASINQTVKLVEDTVAWNTDLHNLIAYFTTSDFACVAIAETNLMLTPQTSDVSINDHSNSLTYVVTAEDGTQERYQIRVAKKPGLTGNDLIGFKLTNQPLCYGTGGIDINGTFTGTAISVSVKYGTNLASLPFSFTLSPGATVSGPSSPANFTSPVTFTVTSQIGVVKTYTVTVTPRAENSEKKLLSYWLASADNAIIGGSDAVAEVDPLNQYQLTVRIPWEARNAVNGLKASFTLSPGATLVHSEDVAVPQVSHVTPNDFTTPVAYTVWAENCTSSVEYFVTVKLLPNTNTGISAFNFAFTPCPTGCALVNNIDTYARRIYITLPYTMDISNLAPSNITLAPGASIVVTNGSKVWTTPQDWTKGPVSYTVTAPDATAVWMVYVTNPPCTENKVLTFSLSTQVTQSQIISGRGDVPVVIDTVNAKISVIINKGKRCTPAIATFTLSCGATCSICNTCPVTESLDFCTADCFTFTVFAENKKPRDWTVCIRVLDDVIPVATTWSVLADNCTGTGKVDSVAVQTNEAGRVIIVNESAINMAALPTPAPLYNLADWTGTGSTSLAGLVSARLGNWTNVPDSMVNKPVYVKTGGLYSGTYWAFSVDKFGNLSCISTQKLFLNICEIDVATLCDLRNQPLVWRYRLTEEVFVTYEENHAGGNWKFVQDATCGILIEDRLGALPSPAYGEGAGITNLRGTLVLDPVQMRFIPVCCYQPTKTSTGHVVTPIDLSYEDFKSQVWTTRTKYESMLVRITTPMKVSDGYYGRLNWFYDAANIYNESDLVNTNAKGASDWGFVQTVLNSPLIGTAFLSTTPAVYTGIRTNVNWGSIYGLMTPRKAADIVAVTGIDVIGNPNPATIAGVLPGTTTCAAGNSVTINIINQGVGLANITAVYLDDNAGVDGFDLLTPRQVPFTIDSWAKQAFTVCFKPVAPGAKSTNLLVEYGIGKILIVPINGSTALIFAMPYLQEFKYTAGPPVLWDVGADFNGYTNYTGWANPTAATAVGGVVIGYYSNWVTPYGGFVDGNRSIFMRPRGGSATAPYLYPVVITSPGFQVTGTDPVVSWVETAWYALASSGGIHAAGNDPDPRILSISLNGVNWTPLRSVRADAMSFETDAVASYTNPTYDQVIVSLKDYIGKTVYFRFDLTIASGKYCYWIIDEFAVKERVTAPIIAVSPGNGDFGGVQVGSTGTVSFAVTNTGISVLDIKKVEIQGATFSLVDTNTYPFEVLGASGVAYPVGNSAKVLNFSANFAPTDVGDKTGKIIITYGLYGDQTLEIPLTGKGLSCLTAAVATIGENLAPTEGVWYKYTAEKFQITQITSCDARNTTVPFTYAWDTYLELYQDCVGTYWGGGTVGVSGVNINDDMEAACPTNRANSSLTVVLNAGETVYIFWKLAFPGTSHVTDPFYFHINPSYPIDGDVCETAIPLTLPVVNKFGTTVGFGDDYNVSPCSPFSNYMDGNDIVYTITVEDGYLIGSILGAYGSIHVLDVCPKTELTKDHCKAFASGPNGGQFRKKIVAGTYFVIISTWAPPQTVDFLLNMSWESGSAVDNADLTNSLSVYPNPNNGKFTVSISNPEATDMTIELVNISGQVVYRNQVKAAYSYNEDIDATTFAKGVYYLKASSAKGVKIEKVVVQ